MSILGVELRASNLHVTYDSRFSLAINHLAVRGNVIAILGHNGAGKSTLIKTMLGLLTPQHGQFTIERFDGTTRNTLSPEEHMAFCPESGAVFHDISVESYVKLWCRLKHNDANYVRGPGRRILEALELAPLLPKLGRELSKGQRRRVQTAIGFLTNPKLFLFDEPFDGLDVQRSSELIELMEQHTPQMSIVLSSHRMDVIERLADAVIVLKDGQVLTSGSVPDVCEVLCGKSLLLSEVQTSDDLLSKIRARFPTALVNRLGNQISLTGHDLEAAALDHYLLSLCGVQPCIHQIPSTLTDAMNYHLKRVRQDGLTPAPRSLDPAVSIGTER